MKNFYIVRKGDYDAYRIVCAEDKEEAAEQIEEDEDLKQIADAEKELAELYKKKENYEAKANLQISESIVNEGKKIDLKKLEQSVEVHLDTVYNVVNKRICDEIRNI